MRIPLETWEAMFGKPIYVIYLCDKLVFRGSCWPDEDGPVELVRVSWLCDEEIEGFFHDKEEAFGVVKANANDMWETLWRYAVVEETYPGIGGLHSEKYWIFKIDFETLKYVEIDTPVLKNDESIVMD